MGVHKTREFYLQLFQFHHLFPFSIMYREKESKFDIHICTHICIHKHTHMHTYTHVHSYSHMCTHTHTYTCTYTCARTHTQVHTYTYMCTHTCTHMCTHAHYKCSNTCRCTQKLNNSITVIGTLFTNIELTSSSFSVTAFLSCEHEDIT